MQSLVTRFSKAGWIKRSIITSGPCNIDFTPIGLKRMDEMVEHLLDMRASGIEPTSLSVGKFGEILHELLPPNFSRDEFLTLIGMIESFRNRTDMS